MIISFTREMRESILGKDDAHRVALVGGPGPLVLKKLFEGGGGQGGYILFARF